MAKSTPSEVTWISTKGMVQTHAEVEWLYSEKPEHDGTVWARLIEPDGESLFRAKLSVDSAAAWNPRVRFPYGVAWRFVP